MRNDNADQIEFWNGPTASNWVAAEERMNELLAPITAAVLEAAAVKPNETVLDVGCGCGATSRTMADAGATVLGIDISEPMLARARERAESESLTFIEADAQSHPFDTAFDLLFSRFGVMFFADPVAAFANLRAALKADGRLCFVCWRAPAENPWLGVGMAAAQPFLPPAETPDPRAPGPFAFADPDYLNQVLNDAGFEDVAITPHDPQMRLGADLAEAMEFVTRVGPLSNALKELEPDQREAALAAVRKALTPFAGPSSVLLGGACWIATGQRGD
ncbi:MAG: methyltransferase domain-containing protein [Pseudomonadales bacterium]|nr:class I SAM-dependent methyltransferase [Pseudomonadales bacterium]NIX06491.1 methyltransferase domain-containing protein [Pseudomonadales bacterium]